MLSFRAASTFLVPFALVACGARSSLDVLASGGKGATGSSTSTSQTGVGGSCPAAATLGPCATWGGEIAPAVLLTNEGNKTSTFWDDGIGLEADGDRVFFPQSVYCDSAGSLCPSGNEPPTWSVRSIAADLGDQGAVELPLTPASDTGAQLYVAARCPLRGAVAFDASLGCVFVPLASNGSAAGPKKVVAADRCGPIRTTANGFAVLTKGTTPSLVHLDANGNVLGAQGLPSFPNTVDDLVAFDDGTFLVVGRSMDWVSLLAAHVDANGAGLSEVQTVVTQMNGFLSRAEVGVGTHALFAWSTITPGTGAMPATFYARWVDEATLTGTTEELTSAGQVESVDVTPTANGALVGWLDGNGYFFQPLAALGGPVGAPIGLPLNVPQAPDGAWYFPLTIRLTATSKGAMASFESEKQVFVTAIGCAP